MGGTIHNNRRMFQLLANAAFLRIIDRPMGGPSNTYSFEYGPGTRQMLTQVQDVDLVAAASVGFPGFASAASGILQAWGTMSAGQRQDAWKLYEGKDVRRWAEVHQETPLVHIPSGDFSGAQSAALSSNAKLGRPDFDATANSVFGPWYNGLAPADRDGFFLNYEEA